MESETNELGYEAIFCQDKRIFRIFRLASRVSSYIWKKSWFGGEGDGLS